MTKYIVFDDETGIEVKRGHCQEEILALQAGPGQTAYPLSLEEEALGLTLRQLPSGEIVPYEA